MTQRLEDNYSDWGAFERSPHESLQKMYFDAANFFEPSLRPAAAVYGPQQVLAGSDIPYFQEEKYVRALDYIRTSKLTDDEKDGVLSANAKVLYGLDD